LIASFSGDWGAVAISLIHAAEVLVLALPFCQEYADQQVARSFKSVVAMFDFVRLISISLNSPECDGEGTTDAGQENEKVEEGCAS
jgi:hypothetical protein